MRNGVRDDNTVGSSQGGALFESPAGSPPMVLKRIANEQALFESDLMS